MASELCCAFPASPEIVSAIIHVQCIILLHVQIKEHVNSVTEHVHVHVHVCEKFINMLT